MASPKTSTLARPFASCGEILTLEIRNCAAGWSMVLLMAVEALLVRGVSQNVAMSSTAATPSATKGHGNLLSGGLVEFGGKGWCSMLILTVGGTYELRDGYRATLVAAILLQWSCHQSAAWEPPWT